VVGGPTLVLGLRGPAGAVSFTEEAYRAALAPELRDPRSTGVAHDPGMVLLSPAA